MRQVLDSEPVLTDKLREVGAIVAAIAHMTSGLQRRSMRSSCGREKVLGLDGKDCDQIMNLAELATWVMDLAIEQAADQSDQMELLQDRYEKLAAAKAA